MKKNVGLVAFIAVCLTACYFIDRTADNYGRSPKNYGEYVALQQSKAVNVKSTTQNAKESEDKKATEKENKVAKEEEKELQKMAFLTFDDGPSKNTEKVLDILDRYNIKATFFVIGEEITPEREGLLKRMIEEGHVIGVHSFNHNSTQIYKTKEACVADVKKTYDKLVEVTGVEPKYYRFPYGSTNCYVSGICNAVIRDLYDMDLAYIDWNVTGEDSVGKPTRYSILKNCKKFDNYMEPVILLHDGKSNKLTAEVLPEIIDKIIAAGYEFGTMDERSKPYQWPHNWHKDN